MNPALLSCPLSSPKLPVFMAGAGGGSPAPEAEAEGKTVRPARTPPTILLVEDNAINQVVALEFLALMGAATLLAKDGFEAIAHCQKTVPDLVLMDIQMPGMDGLECARRLRELQQRGELPHFPILALTAHALAADVEASRDAGMDEHLTKPLDFATLRERIGRWVVIPSANN